MRVFLGVSLPPAVQSSLQALQQAFHVSGRGIRWVSADRMHITVKFFGEITQQQQQSLAAYLKVLAQKQSPFTVSLGPIGGFPSLSAPRVLWVGVEQGAASLVAFAQAVEQESRNHSFKPEERAFHPHVTLARIESPGISRRVGESSQAVKWIAPDAWQVTGAVLYRSGLNAEGPYYEILEEFALSR